MQLQYFAKRVNISGYIWLVAFDRCLHLLSPQKCLVTFALISRPRVKGKTTTSNAGGGIVQEILPCVVTQANIDYWKLGFVDSVSWNFATNCSSALKSSLFGFVFFWGGVLKRYFVLIVFCLRVVVIISFLVLELLNRPRPPPPPFPKKNIYI